MEDGRSKIDSLILNLAFSQLCLSDPGDGTEKNVSNIFDELGVPVIQTMSMFSSREDWEANSSGLGPYEMSMSIFWPEYDGQIISVPIASSEISDDGMSNMPIEDRVSAVADLALNWAELRNTPAGKRRIAVILHQNPPRADMIGGAFGLDATESTARSQVSRAAHPFRSLRLAWEDRLRRLRSKNCCASVRRRSSALAPAARSRKTSNVAI